MARGRRWNESENELLMEMLRNGAPLNEIVKSGKFEGRTPQAIAKQIERLSFVGQRKFKVGQIVKAEILSFEEFVARYVDAFIKLCEMEEFTRDDLERFRLIFMAAWKYRELFREYEELEEVKDRVEKLEGLVAEMATEKKAEAPQQAA